MRRGKLEEVEEYTQQVAQEFGIERPVELVMGKEEDYSAFNPPLEKYKDLPAKIIIYEGWTPKEMKEQIRHELAHAKLHWDIPEEGGYKNAEDLVKIEIEADLLAYGKVPGLQYLMSNLVTEWNFSKRKAYLTVKRVAEALGIPKASISRARTYFYKIPEEFFAEQRGKME